MLYALVVCVGLSGASSPQVCQGVDLFTTEDACRIASEGYERNADWKTGYRGVYSCQGLDDGVRPLEPSW